MEAEKVFSGNLQPKYPASTQKSVLSMFTVYNTQTQFAMLYTTQSAI
jgi:hypothetical protein